VLPQAVQEWVRWQEQRTTWLSRNGRDKQAHGGNDARGPYEAIRFELNCSAEKIRTLSWAEYDASGILVKSGEGGRWGSIWPETLGKILEDGACRNSKLGSKPNEAG
jgi:hypothetical protein